MNGEVPIRIVDVARIVYEKERREGSLWTLSEEEGFEGPYTDRIALELASYARRVLPKWIRSGKMFAEVKAIGRPVAGFGAYRPTAEDVDWLTDYTITVALRLFFRKARERNGWIPDNKASMATYFIGSCVLSFSTIFRTLLKDIQTTKDLDGPAPPDGPAVTSFDDEEGVSDAMSRLGIDGTDAEIVEMMVAGHTRAEIAKLLGMTDRAIEGRLYRLRRRLSAHLPGKRLWIRGNS